MREMALTVDGMRCGGCAVGLERRLATMDGVATATVNFARRIANVAYDPSRVTPEALLEGIEAAGFAASRFEPASELARLEDEFKTRLRGLGIAVLVGMQLMLVAAALYAGEWFGMAPRFQLFFRWLGVGFALALLAFPAREFFREAVRGVRAGRLGMDLPIALGLAVAFGASARAAATGAGEVYFDSMAMFVVLLLVARFLEFQARRSSLDQVLALGRARPIRAMRIDARGAIRPVDGETLHRGDRILVRSEDLLPVDGVIVEGASTFDEGLLTGESRAIHREVGGAVLAGSRNRGSAVIVETTRVGSETVRGRLLALAASAHAAKPRLARLADRVAGRFVAVQLAIAAVVALGWGLSGSAVWLDPVLAVLIVSCPCALSLATPCALGAGLRALARRGIYVANGDALERLPRITRCVFDKTGTLTADRVEVAAVDVSEWVSPERAWALALALERHAHHPLADALLAAGRDRPRSASPLAEDVKILPGVGVEGCIEGIRYRIGRAASAVSHRERASDCRSSGLGSGPGSGSVARLVEQSVPGRTLATFRFQEQLRPGARALIAWLILRGLAVSVLSGDGEEAVRNLADRLGLSQVDGGLDPAGKLSRIQIAQKAGERVLMVGDGINDTPALAAADVSCAIGNAAEVSRGKADLVLVRPEPTLVAEALEIAGKVRRVVTQNFLWAAGYNLLAVPAAAFGLVPPWAAALGMSVSSLVVVVNAQRAGWRRPAERCEPRGS